MILCSDDYSRIFSQMMEEREKVSYYINKDKQKMGRLLKRAATYPVCRCEVITLPNTNNHYLLYHYAKTRGEVLHGSFFSGAPLLLTDDKGRRSAIYLRHITACYGKDREQFYSLQVFSAHFFSRYRERMHLSPSLSPNEVVATYFGRNAGYYAQLDYEQIVLEKNRHKGNSAWGVEDGVILSEVTKVSDELRVFKNNTFLSPNELKPSQEKGTPSIAEMRAMCLWYVLNK